MTEKIIAANSPIPPEDVEPMEILIAVHKRICDAEKIIKQCRDTLVDQNVEIEMLRERLKKLEEK